MLISWEKNPSKDFFSTYQYSDYNSLFLKNNLTTNVVNLYQEMTVVDLLSLSIILLILMKVSFIY